MPFMHPKICLPNLCKFFCWTLSVSLDRSHNFTCVRLFICSFICLFVCSLVCLSGRLLNKSFFSQLSLSRISFFSFFALGHGTIDMQKSCGGRFWWKIHICSNFGKKDPNYGVISQNILAQ